MTKRWDARCIGYLWTGPKVRQEINPDFDEMCSKGASNF